MAAEKELSMDQVPRHSSVVSVNLNNNASAKIQNPLAGLSRKDLDAQVEDFAQKKNLTDLVPLLQKGARLAQNPGLYNDMVELDDSERKALDDEVHHQWRQPRPLYITVIICCVGAAVQGWDQTGSNGANLSFPRALGVGSPTGIDPWIVGLVNAAPFMSSCLIGVWATDPVNWFTGRRWTIFISGVFCGLPVIGSGLAQTWDQLFVTQLLMGIGMGLKSTTVPVFTSENAPAAIRGALVMTWQMWTAFGQVLGFLANLAVKDTGALSWRLQLGSAFIPAVPLCIGIFFCPESPRWLMKKDRYQKAFKSLCKLWNSPLQAARDLYFIHAQLEQESIQIGSGNMMTRFIELFTIPRVRRATLASFVVMIAQQMCGINIVAFFSSTIFVASGASASEALLASLGFGLVCFVFAWPAIWTIDTFGRRNLLIFTFPQMAWTLLAAGFSNLISSEKTRLGVVAFFIYLFTAFYSPGEGPVPFTYSAEVFPLSHREIGMSWAVATCHCWASVLSITFPTLLETFKPVGAFGFYAGLDITALCFIFCFVPETKQRTLEELDYVFAVPTWVHARYQLTMMLPYFCRRYVFWNKTAKVESLYTFDKPEAAEVHEADTKALV